MINSIFQPREVLKSLAGLERSAQVMIKLFDAGRSLQVLHEEHAKNERIHQLALIFSKARLRAALATWLTAVKTPAES